MSKKDYIKEIEGAERRFYAPNMEVRNEGEDDMIEGEAAVVGSETDMGWYTEEIAKGAFDDVLKDDVRALFNHDPNYPLARSKNGEGTLKLEIKSNGSLGYSFKVPNRTYAKDLQDAIKMGDVSQSSFAFKVSEEKWELASKDNGLEKDKRTILKFEKLYDVAPVTYPAYQDTSVAARSAEGLKNEAKEKRDLIQVHKHQAEAIKLKLNLK